jgi:homoserine dehydrogenase
VAVIGAGTVGGGVVDILTSRRDELASRTGGVPVELGCVCDLRDEALAFVREKVGKGVGTTKDAPGVLAREDIDVVVELVGGTTAAKDLVLSAIKAGKSVVTANKALLARAGGEIVGAALEAGVALGFEASVCGGVPLLGAVRNGLVANEISSVTGIVNGTCNYILTRMTREGVPYADVLADAQKAGYAEADPTFDVEGTDSAHKLAVLATLAFRAPVKFDAISCEGIAGLDVSDIRNASEMGYAVKLLAIGKRRGEGLELSVHPALLSGGHPLAAVSDVFNAVEIAGDATGEVMLHGKGAGRMPTASAVVADLVEVARGSAERATRDLAFWAEGPAAKVVPPDESRSRFYVRFSVREEYGVLGQIARILGEHRVSIASVIQKEPESDRAEDIQIVMLTHEARHGDFRAALAGIDELGFMSRRSVFLRIEA